MHLSFSGVEIALIYPPKLTHFNRIQGMKIKFCDSSFSSFAILVYCGCSQLQFYVLSHTYTQAHIHTGTHTHTHTCTHALSNFNIPFKFIPNFAAADGTLYGKKLSAACLLVASCCAMPPSPLSPQPASSHDPF